MCLMVSAGLVGSQNSDAHPLEDVSQSGFRYRATDGSEADAEQRVDSGTHERTGLGVLRAQGA